MSNQKQFEPPLDWMPSTFEECCFADLPRYSYLPHSAIQPRNQKKGHNIHTDIEMSEL